MDKLKRAWARYWPEADVDAMARDVQVRAGDAMHAWDLSGLEPLAGGNIGLVLANRDVVLKVHPRGHPDESQLAAEGVALRAWTPTGAAATLHDVRDGGLTLVMERLTPGTTLDSADMAWEKRLDLIGNLVRRLHCAPAPAPDSIPHIGGEYARGWRRVLGDSPLLEPSVDDVLLHADLHGANVLRSGDSWRVIDPHAVRGDRHADIWALIDPLAPSPSDAATAWAWVTRYAAAADLDPARAAEWVRLRALGEALNGADGDDGWASRLERMASLLRT